MGVVRPGLLGGSKFSTSPSQECGVEAFCAGQDDPDPGRNLEHARGGRGRPPVPWSKPADLPFNPEKPLPKLKGPFANAFHVATLDGATYALRRDIDSTVLRNLIGMDDGNATPDFKTLRANQPVETPEERAALKEQIKRNQKLIEEYERLQKENVELLGKKNAEASELIQVEEQGEKLKELIEGVKARNKNLQSVSETPRGATEAGVDEAE